MKKVYWKDIPGYEVYQGSNFGDIKSLKFGKERILKPKLVKGYYRVGLMKDGKQKLFGVHQLICMAFLGHVPDGNNLVIDHVNGIKTDNYIGTPEGNYKDGNLHVVPHRDNCAICARKDRDTMSSPLSGAIWSKSNNKWKSQYRYQGKKYHLGVYNTDKEASDKYFEAYEADKNGTFIDYYINLKNKLKNDNYKKILQYSKNGEFIRTWNNQTEAGKELKINQANISSCCRGNRKSAGGFIWSYVSDCKLIIKKIKMKKEKILKELIGEDGYSYVILVKDGKGTRVRVDKLVASTFLNYNPNDKTQKLIHIDGDKTNNRADNLEIIKVKN